MQEIEHEDAEKLSVDSFLVDEKKLVKKVLRYIEKHNLKIVDFSHLSDKPVFDVELHFPPKSTESTAKKFWLDSTSSLGIWANHNSNNRNMTSSVIVKYAISILTGTWKNFLPQAGIVFDWNQQGINDQHRLAALYLASLVEPNVKIGFEVAFNADPEDIKLYDVNRVKTECDLLTVDAKIDDTFDNYEGVDQTRLLALVKQMPTVSKLILERRRDFIKSNIHKLKECLTILADVQTLTYDKRWAGVFVEAIIGTDGMGFTNPEGENMALAAMTRFCKNSWKVYEDTNLCDPLHLLFKKLVANMNAKKSDKLGKPEIQQMTTYLLRKSLMETPVNGKLGTRTKPKIATFKLEEFEDFRAYGAASQVLKTNSVALRSSKKKRRNSDDD